MRESACEAGGTARKGRVATAPDRARRRAGLLAERAAVARGVAALDPGAVRGLREAGLEICLRLARRAVARVAAGAEVVELEGSFSRS